MYTTDRYVDPVTEDHLRRGLIRRDIDVFGNTVYVGTGALTGFHPSEAAHLVRADEDPYDGVRPRTQWVFEDDGQLGKAIGLLLLLIAGLSLFVAFVVFVFDPAADAVIESLFEMLMPDISGISNF